MSNLLQEQITLDSIVLALPEVYQNHSRGSAIFNLLETCAQNAAKRIYGPKGEQIADLFPDVPIQLPYFEMGAINSTHLFGLDELIMFAYYFKQRPHIRRVLDIGANIGLHSIILSKLGFEVKSYEPDPEHFATLQKNIEVNSAQNIEVVNEAVSTEKGLASFVRVLGNTTGSHLEGAKSSYGEKHIFEVKTAEFIKIMKWADFIKLDVEGAEARLLCSTSESDWTDVEAFVEIGNGENADAVFAHFKETKVNLFSQKTGWQKAVSKDDVPISHREGSLFISKKDSMTWQ
jgi:FkbM family methyltransferase